MEFQHESPRRSHWFRIERNGGCARRQWRPSDNLLAAAGIQMKKMDGPFVIKFARDISAPPLQFRALSVTNFKGRPVRAGELKKGATYEINLRTGVLSPIKKRRKK